MEFSKFGRCSGTSPNNGKVSLPASGCQIRMRGAWPRLCDSMFIKTLLFDALVFMRVPAIPVKSCTYFWIQNMQKFV